MQDYGPATSRAYRHSRSALTPDRFQVLREFLALPKDDDDLIVAAYADYDRELRRLDAAAERMADEPSFEEYVRLLRQLAPVLDPDRQQGARTPDDWEALVQETRASRDDPRWRRVRQLKAATYHRLVELSQDADAALAQFLSRVNAVAELDDEEAASVGRKVRRLIYDIHDTAEYPNYYDFSCPVSIFELSDLFLDDLSDEIGISLLEDDYVVIYDILTDVASEFEVQHDEMLVRHRAERIRLSTMQQLGPVIVGPEDRLYRQFENETLRNWRERYQISALMFQEIEQRLKDEIGDRYARRWSLLYETQLAPDLHAPRAPDRLCNWILQQRSPVQSARDRARRIYGEYIDSRNRAVARLIDLGVKARRRCSSLFGDKPEQSAYMEMVRQYYELSRVCVQRLLGTLEPNRRVAAIREVRLADVGPAAYGPYLPKHCQTFQPPTVEELLDGANPERKDQ